MFCDRSKPEYCILMGLYGPFLQKWAALIFRDDIGGEKAEKLAQLKSAHSKVTSAEQEVPGTQKNIKGLKSDCQEYINYCRGPG